MACDQNDGDERVRNVRHGAHHAGEIEPVDRVHLPIAQDNVRREGLQFLERIRTIVGGPHVPNAECTQNLFDQSLHVLVILDHEDIQRGNV